MLFSAFFCVNSCGSDKMAAKRYSAEEVARFIMEMPGDGDISDDESVVGNEGDAEIDPQIENEDSDPDYPEDFVAVPSTSTGRGRGHRSGRARGRGVCQRNVAQPTVEDSRKVFHCVVLSLSYKNMYNITYLQTVSDFF